MDVDRAGVAVILKAPDLVQQLVAGVDAVRVTGQAGQQLQLLRRGLNDLALDLQFIAVHVKVQIVKVVNACFPPLWRRSGAAQP